MELIDQVVNTPNWRKETKQKTKQKTIQHLNTALHVDIFLT